MQLDEREYLSLMSASRHLASVLNRALGARRTALVAEGMGVDHAHTKLVPLHGIPEGPWRPMVPPKRVFSEQYRGFITTHDGPRARDEDLDRLAERIRSAR